jgi:putative membrane protein
MPRHKILLAALTVLLGLVAWSGWHPYDRATWLMEVFPIFVIAPLLVTTYARRPLRTCSTPAPSCTPSS